MSTRSRSSASTTMEPAATRELPAPIKDQAWRGSTRAHSRCQMISLIWRRVLFTVRIHCCTRALLNNQPEWHLSASHTNKSKRRTKTSIEASKFGRQMAQDEEIM